MNIHHATISIEGTVSYRGTDGDRVAAGIVDAKPSVAERVAEGTPTEQIEF